jgi:CheY-like chemotaxis protein
MSHEIRTPLNAILGMTEIMLMDETNEEKIKHLKLLQFSGKNLLALINDILDFNKIEAGKLELEEIDFNFKQLLESTRSSLLNLAERKGLEINLKYGDDIPKFFKGDSIRLGQVITNLVNNAIKFTEEGYVAIKVRKNHIENNICNLKVEVKDTGIGIPKSKIDKIFKSFEQASSDIARRYGGSGLGLAITKKILEVMGSNIQVNSAEGLGSVFFFELNLPIGNEVEEEANANFDFTDLNDDLQILVAEDNIGNRILIDSLFKRWKIDVEFAYNGLEAVEKIQSKNYNMILMDLQMPEMDGYRATTEIRKMDDIYFKEIPIIALTASVMSNVLEKTKTVGMNGYLSKPFDPKDLRDTIIKHTTEFQHKPDKKNAPAEVKKKEQEAPAKEEPKEQPSSNGSFKYLRELIGDDEDALKDIVKTCIESVEDAVDGLKIGLENEDIKKIREELHVLKPNLHNLEMENLIKDLPQIRDYTEENTKLLNELIKGIDIELSSEKFNVFKQ